MNFESINIWCWLIPILVGVLCTVFGYLLGKGGNTAIDHSSELNLLKDQNAKLKADLAACNKKMSAESTAVVSPEIAFDKSAAKVADRRWSRHHFSAKIPTGGALWHRWEHPGSRWTEQLQTSGWMI